MSFVKESAIWAAEWTHFTKTPSFNLSLITSASNMVRYSVHCGIEVFWRRSNKLLQSTTANALGRDFKASSGLFQLIFGFSIHAQCNLVQLKRSKAPERAYVSDARVLETTRLIFFENQMRGLTADILVWSMASVVAKMRHPFCEWAFSLVAKAASENDKKRIWSNGKDWTLMLTSENRFASASRRLPCNKSATVAQVTLAWRRLSLQDRSGLVFVAAYCRLPINPRKPWSFWGVIGLSGILRRSLETSIGGMSLIYSFWFRIMSPLCSWWIWTPVNVNDPWRWLPNGNLASNALTAWANTASPPPIPSSTWIPRTPCMADASPDWPCFLGEQTNKDQMGKW